MRLQPFQRQPQTNPVIPPALLEFLQAIETAHASTPREEVANLRNVETQTEEEDRFQDMSVSIGSVTDQDDGLSDHDGENGKFLQIIY